MCLLSLHRIDTLLSALERVVSIFETTKAKGPVIPHLGITGPLSNPKAQLRQKSGRTAMQDDIAVSVHRAALDRDTLTERLLLELRLSVMLAQNA